MVVYAHGHTLDEAVQNARPGGRGVDLSYGSFWITSSNGQRASVQSHPNTNQVKVRDMSTITRSDVEYVAGLAQLQLDEAATERLVGEMNHILGYMEKLNELNTDDVEPMMHAMALTNIFREDEVKPSLPREIALRGAPVHDNEYFMVPKILDVEGGGA